MDIMLTLVLIVTSLALVIYSLWPKNRVDEDVLRRRMLGKRGMDETATIQNKAKDSAARRVLERMAPLAMRPVMPKDASQVSMLRVKLANAGFRRENSATMFLASKTVCAVGVAVLCLVLMITAGKPFFHALMWMAGGGGIGFMLPDVWLKMAMDKRAEKIKHGLPDSMDLMVISVESGLALDAAIQRVGDEMRHVHPELAEEMQIVTYEGQMGIPRSEALSNMAMRSGVPEVRSLVAVITQAEKFGTSVAAALRNQAEALRTKRRQAAEEAAQKTTVKLMLPLILFIFPAIFVVLVGPAIIKMMQNFDKV